MDKSTSTMENKAFKSTDTGTELAAVSVGSGKTTVKATTTCNPQVCRTARQDFQPPDLAHQSPWNTKKTYFFIGTIVLLVVWIIVYATISHLNLV